MYIFFKIHFIFLRLSAWFKLKNAAVDDVTVAVIMAATKVLNVAEKNDVAKTISEMLARGRYNRRDGASVYNKIYEFPFQVDRKRDGKFFSQNGQRLIDQLQTSVVN